MKKISFILFLVCLAFAMYGQEVVVHSDGVDIYGMLIAPQGALSVCIIVPGSGAIDMDGNNLAGLKTDCYKLLAENLAEGGVASFRYDKRGVGKSVIDKKDEIIFDTGVSDVAKIIATFKEMNRFTNIYLIGHSEGSLISILASKLEAVSGIVSVSGVGKNAGNFLVDQMQKQLSATIVKEVRKIIKSLQKGQLYKGDIPVLLQNMFSSANQKYLISWFKYDPRKEIAKTGVPCLILHGEADSQVNIENAKLLKSAKKDASFKTIENMTHLLKEIKNKNEEQNTYLDSSYPIAKELINEILKFVKENTK